MNWRRLAAIVGLAVFVASVVLLARQLQHTTADLLEQGFGREELTRLVFAFPLYLVGIAFVHVAWAVMVTSALAAPTRDPVRGFGLSSRAQIAKYLPGNVAYLIGRQLLARRLGWSQTTVAGASFVEVIGLILVAITLVVVAAPAAGIDTARVEFSATTIVLGLLVVAAAAAFVIALRIERMVPIVRRVESFGSVRFRVTGCYLAFFALSGTAQALLLPEYAFVDVWIASTVAWIIGCLTPGVPAGLGVREATIAIALDLDAGAIASGVLSFRIVMIVADLVLWAVGSLIERSRMRGVAPVDPPTSHGDPPRPDVSRLQS